MSEPLDAAVSLASVLLATAAAAAVARLVLGPRLLDRIVAIDVLGAIVVGLLVVTSLRVDEPSLIDVALAFALVSFVGTIAVAHYVEERGRDA